ncbi:ATP-binding domain-containing protein [Bacillus thuringiensis]|nr:ATP-binding domain-containing protein [Bacillus thuringiensis]
MKFRIFDEKSYELDSSAKVVRGYLEEQFKARENCIAYYRDPLYYTEGGLIPTWVIVDEEFGIVVIKTYNFTNDNLSFIGENYWVVNEEKQPNELFYFEDYCYEFKKDLDRPSYKLRGKMNFTSFIILPFVKFVDGLTDGEIDITNIMFDDFRSKSLVESLKAKKLNDFEVDTIHSIIQKANVLGKSNAIKLEEPVKNLREAIAINEQKLYLFDDAQLNAGLSITNNAERIRGLAGTGKTIILAMKAARMHYIDPDAKILYTFYTQALYTQIKNLISRFFRKIAGDEPNWDNLRVMHAWGGKAREGVYSSACMKNGIKPKSFREVMNSRSPFGEVCKVLLDKPLIPEYDVVLIDEAQDLPVEFFMAVAKLTKKPRKIVWAYDELQTTGDIRIPDAKELFGVDEQNNPMVILNTENDHILYKSYRNHLSVLFLAVAVGFGLYNKKGIVQMIEEEQTWKALGFDVKNGSFNPGESMEIERPIKNSPSKVDKSYEKQEILSLYRAETKQEEVSEVAQKIINLVKVEKVNPHDIMVIDLNQKSARENLDKIQLALFKEEINSVIPGLVDGAADFFVPDCVTLTTVRRAKGNEAPVVFVMGMENMYSYKNKLESKLLRNMAFVSLSRTKGWCFISGTGENMDMFIDEHNRIMKDIPILKFVYPSEKELEEIGKINYLSEDKEAQRKYQAQIQLLNELLEGDMSLTKLLLTKDLKEKLKVLGEE